MGDFSCRSGGPVGWNLMVLASKQVVPGSIPDSETLSFFCILAPAEPSVAAFGFFVNPDRGGYTRRCL